MPVHSEFLANLDAETRKALEKRLLDRQTGKCFICDDPIDLFLSMGQLDIDHKPCGQCVSCMEIAKAQERS